MHNFKELKVWRESISLAKNILAVTQLFPGDEKFGLTAQMRRCAVAIPSNIAEGAAGRPAKIFVDSWI
jgi:four helix bundle protein